MKFLSLVTMASLASATAVNVNQRASPIEIKLEAVGNTQVKATVTNTGSTGYNLFKKGTILDSALVEKLQVFSANTQVPFQGMRLRLKNKNLSSSSFTTLEAGKSVTVTVDMAMLHDVTQGGAFDVFSQGSFSYAEVGSTELTGKVLPFASNKLSMLVDGAKAATVARPLGKRTELADDCSGDQLSAVQTALSNCANLASAAAQAATSGSASKFQEYFKTTSSSTRRTVAARLNAVAQDCSSTTDGATTTHCQDIDSGCSSDVLAYTVPSGNYIVYCGIYFSDLPDLANQCHEQDRATTTIHEETHAPAVYSPGTLDNGYGYDAATALSASQALNNADTYALYSNAINLGC